MNIKTKEIASKALPRGILEEASLSELRTSEPSLPPAFFTEFQTDEMALYLRSRSRPNHRIDLEFELSTVAHISYGRMQKDSRTLSWFFRGIPYGLLTFAGY